MSRLVPQVYAAVVLGFISTIVHAGDPIHWAPDLESARAAAAAQNKLLLLHFWTPDCAPCKVVDQNVFPVATVAQAINQNYVPLKVNAYRNPDLRDHFQVDRWPTDVVATVDGQTVSQMVTPQHPDRYVNELMTVVMKHRSSKEIEATGQIASGQVHQSATPLASQRDNQSRWADGVEAPELSENTARAARPGVNPQLVPGGQPDFRSRAADFGTNRFSSEANQGASRFEDKANFTAAGASNFGAANSRFGARDDVSSGPSPNNSEVANPYVQSRGYENGVAEYTASNSPPSRNQPPNELAGRPGSARQQVAEVTQPEHPPIGLDGRCPVTLIRKGTWKKGDDRWGAIHRGNLYLFAGEQQQQVFLKDPDKFSPVLAGMDVVRLAEVGKVVRGDRQFGVLFDDDGSGPNSSRIYLFDSVESRNRFESTPDVFLRPVMQAMQRGNLDTLLR